MSVIAYARIVREELEEALKSIEIGLLQGVEDWDKYQNAVGRRRGLLQALAIVDETMARFDEKN